MHTRYLPQADRTGRPFGFQCFAIESVDPDLFRLVHQLAIESRECCVGSVAPYGYANDTVNRDQACGIEEVPPSAYVGFEIAWKSCGTRPKA